MFDTASKEQKEAAAGIMSLFSLIGDTSQEQFSKPPKVKRPQTKQELLLKEKHLLGFFLTGHPLDAYRDILRRLSCVPMEQIEGMAHDTVFRTAFIIDTVQTRVSSKSQKKFAILVISDGIERFELPIWPEMFEEKGHLLKENQPVYAVLQVDKKEEGLKLSCRWFDDLAAADESMIDACDQAFDKAKHQASRQAYLKTTKTNTAKDAKTTKLEQVENTKKLAPAKADSPMIFRINATDARLSHILKLKTIMAEHRGSNPVQIDFLHGAHIVASLHIDSQWGVVPSQQLTDAVSAVLSQCGVS
jgi:DNA polymerase-3 subunit alpha